MEKTKLCTFIYRRNIQRGNVDNFSAVVIGLRKRPELIGRDFPTCGIEGGETDGYEGYSVKTDRSPHEGGADNPGGKAEGYGAN